MIDIALVILKSYWKYAAIALLLFGAYSFYNNKIEQAYDRGVIAERSIWDAKVAAENKKNREFENIINAAINQHNEKLIAAAVERVSKETVINDKITTIIKNNPIYEECKVDKEVIDLKNQIRDMGPK